MAETSQALLLRATSFITRHYLMDCGEQIRIPLRTAELLATVGRESENTRLLVAALIHDVCSNRQVEEEQVERAFGMETWALIMEVKGYCGGSFALHDISFTETLSANAKKLLMAVLIARIENIMYCMPEITSYNEITQNIMHVELIVEAVGSASPALVHYFQITTRHAVRDGVIRKMEEAEGQPPNGKKKARIQEEEEEEDQEEGVLVQLARAAGQRHEIRLQEGLRRQAVMLAEEAERRQRQEIAGKDVAVQEVE